MLPWEKMVGYIEPAFRRVSKRWLWILVPPITKTDQVQQEFPLLTLIREILKSSLNQAILQPTMNQHFSRIIVPTPWVVINTAIINSANSTERLLNSDINLSCHRARTTKRALQCLTRITQIKVMDPCLIWHRTLVQQTWQDRPR